MPSPSEHLERAWAPSRALEEVLTSWLATQRWFAAKGRAIASVRIADAAWLRAPGPTTDAWVLVEVALVGDQPQRYAIWLGVRGRADAATTLTRSGLDDDAVIAEVAVGGAGVLSLLATGESVPTLAGGRLLATDRDAAAARLVSTSPAVRAIGADQSNTSLRVGDRLVLKLLRRVQPGENPELEVLRCLAMRTSFTEMAAPRGAVSYIDAGQVVHTIALLQDWVENEADGWKYVVARLEAQLATPGAWPSWAADMDALGRATARFHRASAAATGEPAFGAAAVPPAEIRAWQEGLAQRASAARELLTRAPSDALDTAAIGAHLALVAAGGGPVPSSSGTGALVGIRVHGDYHLGQTLKTTAGFILIDFEGEPARTLEERRRRYPALKDVAGMLRSFDYAMAVASGSTPAAAERLRAELPLDRAFLDAYLDEAAGADLMPAAPGPRDRWLRFFLIDKAVYELEYELNNRPAWAAIPARAIARLVGG